MARRTTIQTTLHAILRCAQRVMRLRQVNLRRLSEDHTLRERVRATLLYLAANATAAMPGPVDTTFKDALLLAVGEFVLVVRRNRITTVLWNPVSTGFAPQFLGAGAQANE